MKLSCAFLCDQNEGEDFCLKNCSMIESIARSLLRTVGVPKLVHCHKYRSGKLTERVFRHYDKRLSELLEGTGQNFLTKSDHP